MSPSAPRAFRAAWLRRLWQGFLVVFVVAALAAAGDTTRQNLSHVDEKQAFPGVANFGRLHDRLWRGAQPDLAGFEQLKARGVNIVVSFTLAGEAQLEEEQVVRDLGMQFVGIPWSAESVPTADQVSTFLGTIRDHPAARIFLHCKRGADRTGVMVAIYRLTFDHWTADAAISEMEAFHHYWFLLPHLERFVRAYALAHSAPAVYLRRPPAPHVKTTLILSMGVRRFLRDQA
jgi:protein tyrosine phosphatase (PTP) superfamily phosphohydrolase (DUF442 family)